MDFPAYRVVSSQLVVALVATALAYLLFGSAAAKAALYGGFVALANALFLVWRLYRGRRSQQNLAAHQHLRSFYRSSLERFFVVVLLLAGGLGALKLMPLAVLVSFVLGQLTLIVSVSMRG